LVGRVSTWQIESDAHAEFASLFDLDVATHAPDQGADEEPITGSMAGIGQAQLLSVEQGEYPRPLRREDQADPRRARSRFEEHFPAVGQCRQATVEDQAESAGQPRRTGEDLQRLRQRRIELEAHAPGRGLARARYCGEGGSQVDGCQVGSGALAGRNEVIQHSPHAMQFLHHQ